jgi:hypothetical protein
VPHLGPLDVLSPGRAHELDLMSPVAKVLGDLLGELVAFVGPEHDLHDRDVRPSEHALGPGVGRPNFWRIEPGCRFLENPGLDGVGNAV